MIVAIYHAHTQFNNHSDPNQPRKREHDPTHLDQQHHAEADCALALDASLLQKDLDATTKHMPASTIATYHAHTQFNNHSDPNQPRKREHDPTQLDQQHHAEADCAVALDASNHYSPFSWKCYPMNDSFGLLPGLPKLTATP